MKKSKQSKKDIIFQKTNGLQNQRISKERKSLIQLYNNLYEGDWMLHDEGGINLMDDIYLMSDGRLVNH